MKRMIAVLLVAVLLVPSTIFAGQGASEYIDVKLELKIGEEKMWKNGVETPLLVPAYLSESGYTMLPVREIAEVFPGRSVRWDKETNQAQVLKGEKFAYATIFANGGVMRLNGYTVPLKTPSEIKDGRTFVSIRDICQIYDIPDENILWDSRMQKVTIYTKIPVDDGSDGSKYGYTEKELKEAKERLSRERERLGLNSIATYERHNSLLVTSDHWTEEKKEKVIEVAGIEDIIFKTRLPGNDRDD